MSYLIENLECERLFLSRLGFSWDQLAPMLGSLGVHPHLCWALIEVDMTNLVSSLKGDVDILAGNVTWNDPKAFEFALEDHMSRLQSSHPDALIQFMSPEACAAAVVAEAGGLRWPPSTEYLVGIEVKCSRLDQDVNPYTDPVGEPDMKSTKSSRQKKKRIRLEIIKLIRLGCDKVALLDLIANPPANGINMNAWLNASVATEKTEKAMARVLGERLPPDSVAGHWVYSIGAVAGGDETIRGTGLPRVYREAQVQQFNSSGGDNLRDELTQGVTRILGGLPQPASLPALFLNCRLCRRIHGAMDGRCPQWQTTFSNIPSLN